jgi:hypothetical protein
VAFTMLGNDHLYLGLKHVHHPKKGKPILTPLPFPNPGAVNSLLSLWFYLLWIHHRTIQLVTFCIWLSHRIMLLKFIPTVECISTSFCFMDKWRATADTHHALCICLGVNGHLSCFHLLDVVNSATLNIYIHIFVWVSIFNSFGSISQCRICWVKWWFYI